MKLRSSFHFIIACHLFGLAQQAAATVITFDDFTIGGSGAAASFNAQGLTNTYQGFEWGYGNSAGVAGRTFVDSNFGWGTATATQAVVFNAPIGIGSGYAWNWGGPMSLWIDFRSITTVNSAEFAILSSSFGANSSSVQLFGYDASNVLVGTSSTLALTGIMQTLNANFSGVRYLEIRSNAVNSWFSVDDLRINEGANVPESAPSVLLLGGALSVLVWLRRFREQG